jgi:hypothetical protein
VWYSDILFIDGRIELLVPVVSIEWEPEESGECRAKRGERRKRNSGTKKKRGERRKRNSGTKKKGKKPVKIKKKRGNKR